MTCKKTYKCNLCNGIRETNELFCLYWDSTEKSRGTENGYGEYVLTANVNNSDNHICTKCIEIIKEFKLN